MARFRGFWALVLATPHQGRAIPCRALTRASRTVAELQDSRNLNHWRVFDTLKDLLGERPLVLDRGFSYLEGLRYLLAGQVYFVIRLNLDTHPPEFWDTERREVWSEVGRGETVIHHKVRYKMSGKLHRTVVGDDRLQARARAASVLRAHED